MEIEYQDLGEKSKYLVWNEHRSQIIGSATLIDSEDPVLLKEINIQRNRRSRGVGSVLLKRILEDFAGSEMEAEVFSSRTDWYVRHGFEVEEDEGRLVKVKREPQ